MQRGRMAAVEGLPRQKRGVQRTQRQQHDSKGAAVDQPLEYGSRDGGKELCAAPFGHVHVDDHLGVEDFLQGLPLTERLERNGLFVPVRIASQDLDNPELAEFFQVGILAFHAPGGQFQQAVVGFVALVMSAVLNSCLNFRFLLLTNSFFLYLSGAAVFHGMFNSNKGGGSWKG